MKKSFFVVILLTLSISSTFSQKYIKYIFLENKIKIVIPVKLEKKDPSLFQEQEVVKILKAWQTKKAETTLFAFEVKTTNATDICKQTESTFSQFSFMTSDKSVRSTKTLFINNRQEVCLMEINSTENNTSKKYEVIFSSKTSENSLIVFYFSCPYEKKKHWQPIINGMIKDLTIQL